MPNITTNHAITYTNYGFGGRCHKITDFNSVSLSISFYKIQVYVLKI